MVGNLEVKLDSWIRLVDKSVLVAKWRVIRGGYNDICGHDDNVIFSEMQMVLECRRGLGTLCHRVES